MFFKKKKKRYGLVVRISGFHPGGSGSIPGIGILHWRAAAPPCAACRPRPRSFCCCKLRVLRVWGRRFRAAGIFSAVECCAARGVKSSLSKCQSVGCQSVGCPRRQDGTSNRDRTLFSRRGGVGSGSGSAEAPKRRSAKVPRT